MRKLYENIKVIKYRGSPHVLTEIIQNMDKSMQEFAQKTEQMKAFLIKSGSSNWGIQYNKACQATRDLSCILYEQSTEMNLIQKQIVILQNKSFIFEDMSSRASNPRPHNVRKIDVSVNTKEVYLTVQICKDVVKNIEYYISYSMQTLKSLKNDKSHIGEIWVDPQFKDFSIFIDNLIKIVFEGLKNLEEYKQHLINNIKVVESNGADC